MLHEVVGHTSAVKPSVDDLPQCLYVCLSLAASRTGFSLVLGVYKEERGWVIHRFEHLGLIGSRILD